MKHSMGDIQNDLQRGGHDVGKSKVNVIVRSKREAHS